MTAASATGDGMSGSRSTAAELAGKLLSGRTGRAFWRSLDELARMPEFDAALSLEFPGLASPASAIDRRSVLRVMAASLALAGLTGCDGGADETALPYVRQPEGELPGKARWYATAVTLGGIAQPAVGRTYAGRPVKLEGNSDHPATAGATDPFLQAALLGLYDPERSQTPRHLGRPVAWQRIEGTLAPEIAELDRRGGAGFRLVMGSVTSPTLARQLAALAARWPESRWHAFEPLEDRARHKATARILGADLDQH
ncbi:MAG: TAT-variant-translocated molybdopterin oxidoreductase, partial [Alphaproteobacteria bacterium]